MVNFKRPKISHILYFKQINLIPVKQDTLMLRVMYLVNHRFGINFIYLNIYIHTHMYVQTYACMCF